MCKGGHNTEQPTQQLSSQARACFLQVNCTWEGNNSDIRNICDRFPLMRLDSGILSTWTEIKLQIQAYLYKEVCPGQQSAELRRINISSLLCFSPVQSLSRVQLCNPMHRNTPASLSITNSQSLPKLMSIESVMLSNHLICCHPLLLLPSIFPSIRVLSNKSALHIRRPKYWSFSFNISPSNEHPGLISLRMEWVNLLAV